MKNTVVQFYDGKIVVSQHFDLKTYLLMNPVLSIDKLLFFGNDSSEKYEYFLYELNKAREFFKALKKRTGTDGQE